MKKTIKLVSALLLLSAVLVFLNYYFFSKAAEFSEIYPFNRVHLGNTLTAEIDTAGSSYMFNSKIIRIEGEKTNNSNFISILEQYKNFKKLHIITSTDEFPALPIVKNINQSYMFFLLFIIMFGSVHFIWGSITMLRRPDEIRTKLFFYNSIAISLFFFAAMEQFTFGNLGIVFILSAISTGILNIYLAYNFTNNKLSKKLFTTIILFAAVIIGYSIRIIVLYGSINSTAYILMFCYILFCSLLTLQRLIYGLVIGRHAFAVSRNLIIFISLFIGNSLPVLNILSTAFTDPLMPVCFSSGLSLCFPLIMGTAILRYNQFDFTGYKIFQFNDFKLLISSIIIAASCTILMYSLLTISGMIYNKVLYVFTAAFIIILLLDSQQFLIRSMKSYGFENKDNYAFSAQKIAELISSSENIQYKISNIYKEIRKLTHTKSVKLVVFMDIEDDYFSNIANYAEVLNKKSNLYSLLTINKNTILKYALNSSEPVEKKVYDILDERNAIFSIPIIERDDVKGALLIGEKRTRAFFNDEDICFLQTVMHQILQLIESDRLYKDYILKRQYETDLDNASYVQMRLFPKVALKGRGLYITFFYRPYLRVIGDYFDFFKIDEDRTAIIIGDVSGHGLSTAMVLSAVNSITHAILQEGKPFEKTFIEINNYLSKSYKGFELITLFIGIFNRKTRVMDYVNAGHWAPILIRKQGNKIEQIKGRSKILGATSDVYYAPLSINLMKNDELILYTDGLMEIHNEMTGTGVDEQKFMNIIQENIEKDIDGKILEIEKTIKGHSKDIKDDITIIGVKIH